MKRITPTPQALVGNARGARRRNVAGIHPPTDDEVVVIRGLSDLKRIPSNHLAQLEMQLSREVWQTSPDLWIEERCREFVWSKQREICESVVRNRRTAVPSCHGPGKSFIASRLAAWWIDTHKSGEAFVVTTASVGRQVRTILWREIGRIHARARLPGRTNQTEWYLQMPEGNEEIVAFGMKPDDFNPTAFQGIHAKYVLVIADEACGIGRLLWDAMDSLLSNDYSRFLAIGNPDDPETEFKDVCAPGSGWNVIHISAFDTPNFTGEKVPADVAESLIGKVWVDEKTRKWGTENPVYVSKILGEFPESSTDGLIPMKWIKSAQARELIPSEPSELGMDIGGGGDPNVIAHRRGPRVRVIRKDHEPDTMVSLGHLIQARRDTQAKLSKVDMIGIGTGMVNRAHEQKLMDIIGVKVSESATDPEQFANLRAEGFWGLRQRFQDGDIDIDADDDDLAAQLAALKYRPNSRGQTVIVSKKELREDIHRSPDEADAVMLAFLTVPKSQPEMVSW